MNIAPVLYSTFPSALMLIATAASSFGKPKVDVIKAIQHSECKEEIKTPRLLSAAFSEKPNKLVINAEFVFDHTVPSTRISSLSTLGTARRGRLKSLEGHCDIARAREVRFIAGTKWPLLEVTRYMVSKIAKAFDEIKEDTLYYQFKVNNNGAKTEYLYNPLTGSLEEISNDVERLDEPAAHKETWVNAAPCGSAHIQPVSVAEKGRVIQIQAEVYLRH